MGCPVLRFLPEIATIAERLKDAETELDLLGAAENICSVCRNRTSNGQCPLGKKFGCALRDCLPDIVEIIERILKRRGDGNGKK